MEQKALSNQSNQMARTRKARNATVASKEEMKCGTTVTVFELFTSKLRKTAFFSRSPF